MQVDLYAGVGKGRMNVPSGEMPWSLPWGMRGQGYAIEVSAPTGASVTVTKKVQLHGEREVSYTETRVAADEPMKFDRIKSDSGHKTADGKPIPVTVFLQLGRAKQGVADSPSKIDERISVKVEGAGVSGNYEWHLTDDGPQS